MMIKVNQDQTLGEEIANAISHGVMALFGFVALMLLIIKASSPLHVVAAIIFGFGIVNLYTMSTIYHALTHKTAKSVFKRLDHLSIYILIGGTFAPPLLLLPGLQRPLFGIEGMIGVGIFLFIIQWLIITVGVVFKSIWIKKFAKLHLFLYLAMGWSSLVFIQALLEYNQQAFWYVLAGGLAYTAGVLFYVLGKVKYFHFIWHIFTSLGTIFQFIAIYFYLY